MLLVRRGQQIIWVMQCSFLNFATTCKLLESYFQVGMQRSIYVTFLNFQPTFKSYFPMLKRYFPQCFLRPGILSDMCKCVYFNMYIMLYIYIYDDGQHRCVYIYIYVYTNLYEAPLGIELSHRGACLLASCSPAEPP